jgi:outer membrane protein assembly factor BamB
MKRTIECLVLLTCFLLQALAEDWPEWRGKGRRGDWIETGILGRFPEKGLRVAWRAPVAGGYAGPAVAAGRVFVTDFERSAGMTGTERAQCLDEKTGKVL